MSTAFTCCTGAATSRYLRPEKKHSTGRRKSSTAPFASRALTVFGNRVVVGVCGAQVAQRATEGDLCSLGHRPRSLRVGLPDAVLAELNLGGFALGREHPAFGSALPD